MPAPVTAVGDYVAPIRKRKPQSQIRVAAPARDGDEGVNREGELRETEQPEIFPWSKPAAARNRGR
jgi:hypothetical protein